MSFYRFIYALFSGLLLLSLISCEDLIQLEVNDAEANLVIVAEINNQETQHEVRIHRTLSLSSRGQDPVSGASVLVTDSAGRQFEYSEVEPGLYRSRTFRGRIGMTYHLSVDVENDRFEAFSTMPWQVPVDSIGTAISSFMGEERIFITLKFNDPPAQANFYEYKMSVNDGPMRFHNVYDDRFNDGRAVTHELFDMELELQSGDKVRVQRRNIEQATYLYWRSVASANPAASSPANPPSNISNGALGYFSVYSINEYEVYVP